MSHAPDVDDMRFACWQAARKTEKAMKFDIDVLPPEAFDVDATMRRMKCTREVATELVQMNLTTVVYTNETYQVNVRNADIEAAGSWPAMTHLSIKRRDKGPIHDWREFQAIKNAILGPEHEAVELYPAESRLTDTANQYHLWALKESGVRFPFGYFDGRNVTDEHEAKRVGATQRPL